MFYGQCNDCGERWELGTAPTCKCPDEALAEPDFWEGYVPEPVKPRGEATLAQQEPVDSTQISKVWWDGEKLMANPIPFVEFYKPVQRTWVHATPWRGLTDEEIESIFNNWPTYHLDHEEFARAIEAKLKEKNT